MVRTQSSPAPKSNPNPRQNGTRATTTTANGTSGPVAAAVRTIVHQQHSNDLVSLKSTVPTQPPQHRTNSVDTPTKRSSSKSRTNGVSQPPPSHTAQAQVAPTFSRTTTSRPSVESADTAFESGAWLFDASRMPAWLAQQLQPTAVRSSSSTPVKSTASKTKQQARVSSARTATRQEEGQVIRLGSRPVREQPVDIGFDTGAWLFDESQRPEWLKSELVRAPSSSGRNSRSQQKRTSAAPAAVYNNDVDQASSPPSPKQRSSQSANPLAMSWAQVAASPPTSPNRTFAARPPSKHRDPPSSSKRSRSLPHRRIQRSSHHQSRPSPATTTAASTTQALDLPPATHDDHNAPDAAYSLHSSDPTYPLSLSAAHARMHVLHYAHRAANDCGPVPLTSQAAERVREALHVKASRALLTFSVLCLVLSVSLAGLVARTGRPLVPANVGRRWAAASQDPFGGVSGTFVVGARGARERLRPELQSARNAWVVEADEDGVQGKIIYA